MKNFIIFMAAVAVSALGHLSSAMNHRGVVYDVGLHYSPEACSVAEFNPESVEYDMHVIKTTLHANAVRIEGEDLARLEKAAECAAKCGLKVFYNPWLMGGDEETVVKYMLEAAKGAERLRREDVDLVFVAGCEYSLFCKGIFDGETLNDRIASMTALATSEDAESILKDKNTELNRILKRIADTVRSKYKGKLTYSAGTWEDVDWNMFDIVGIDYYRDTQTADEYKKGIKAYKKYKKPVYVMEVGCCAFEGASQLGAGGFAVCLGTTADGKGIYRDGVTPKRSETEQAEYIEEQIGLLNDAGVNGIFVFEFAFPIMPYSEEGFDGDMTSYPIVKSFAADDPRSQVHPGWEPKEAFFVVAEQFAKLQR